MHALPVTSVYEVGEDALGAVKQHLLQSTSHSRLVQANSAIWLTVKPAHSQQPLTLGIWYVPPASHRSAQRNSAQASFDSMAAHLPDASARTGWGLQGQGGSVLAGDFKARVGPFLLGTSRPGWATARTLGSQSLAQEFHQSCRTLTALSMHTATSLCTCVRTTQASFKVRSNIQTSRLVHVLVDADRFHARRTCKIGTVRAEPHHHPL